MQIDLVKHPHCRQYQEWSAYIPAEKQLAVLDISQAVSLPEYVANYMNPTARNRLRYSMRHYETRLISPRSYIDEIHAINTSAPVRQGNPMRETYLQKPSFPVNYIEPCGYHFYRHFGCFENGTNKLVAYATVHVSGELCALTQIIGHAAYLKDGIMLNLFASVVQFALENNTRCILYSRWTDGTEGLRHWKYSVGFRCGTIETGGDISSPGL